jgi:hypothetical protein
MTAIEFALVVLWRTVNAALTAATVIPLFVVLAIGGWPLFDAAGVGLSVCAFAFAVARARRARVA